MTESTPAAIDALRASAARLRGLAAALTPDQLASRAYPSEWTQAQVLSHLGSGAVIMQRRLDDTLAGRATPDDHAPGVWETWNAKKPAAQRDDALEADADLLSRIEAVTPTERESFVLTMGPMTLGFADFVRMRLNEHALHTWDLEVIHDAMATLAAETVPVVVDNLGLIARFTAKPTGEAGSIRVATSDPERGFTVALTPDAVTFAVAEPSAGADLQLPAEAFVRLVYGRLDPDHTPPGQHGPALDTLRRVFPGP